MGEAIAIAIAVVILGSVLIGLPVLAARVRRTGVGASTFSPFEEIWYPAAHRARIEVEVQVVREDPSPTPGDPLGPVIAARSERVRHQLDVGQPDH